MINAVNAQFSRFVAFAQERFDAGKTKAIASKGDIMAAGGTTLEERKIKVTDKFDWVSLSFLRSNAAQRANNEVRDIFRKTVADMFGGERNIPDSVREAMLMKDYGHGKPLTARRILAVRDAIENLRRDNAFDKTHDPDGKLADKAFAAGYTRLDFGRLNTAANLLAKTRNMGLAQAMEEVITRGSAANRLMNAGSLYMKSPEAFREGYSRFEHIANGAARNLEVAKACGSADATRNLSEIAQNLVYNFSNLLDAAEGLREAANLPEDTLDNLKTIVDSNVNKMSQIESEISTGELTDRKAIYDRMFYHDMPARFSEGVERIVLSLREAAKGNPAIAEFLQHLKSLAHDLGSECVQLTVAYKHAVAQDMAKSAELKLRAAAAEAGMATGTQVSVPDGIYDNLVAFLEVNPFVRMPNVDKFCANLEKHGDANLRFSAAQKADLKALVEQIFGKNPKADKILLRLIDKFETSFFAEELHSPTDFGNHPPAHQSFIVDYLKKNPEVLRAFDPGFKLERDEDFAALKSDIKEAMLTDLNQRLNDPDKTKVSSLSSGLMPQGVREYDPGYVTFNGQKIPDAQLGTKFPQLGPECDTPGRKGYAEFLEKTFDASHRKMRQMVSYSCSMANGFGGMIDSLIEYGTNKCSLKGPSREELRNKGTIISPAERMPEDNYNLEIAQNGDVKITLTRFIQNKVNVFMDLENGGAYSPRLISPSPETVVIGATKITATMTIKNATDAELGNRMPEFTIDDVRQEEILV